MADSKKPESPHAQSKATLSKVLLKLQGEIKIVQAALNAPGSENVDIYVKDDGHILSGGYLKSA
jgi:hypothetical protein